MGVRIAKVKLHLRRVVVSGAIVMGLVAAPYLSLLSTNPVAAAEPWQTSGWSQISVGNAHTCALTSDAKVYCWGYGTSGQLGTGASTNSSFPIAVSTTGVLAGKTITAVDAGTDYSCVLTSEGRAYCWGTNASGQLGNNTTQTSLVPVAVSTSGVLAGKTLTAISAGTSHTCAVASDHHAYCWGRNINGQLGDGTGANSLVPVAVETTGELAGKSVVSVSAGHTHSCAVTTDGLAYCWGSDFNGQLGTDLGGGSLVPLPVDMAGVFAGKTISVISAGVAQTCAIASDHKAYCWGANAKGQLGDGTTQERSLPVAVSTAGVLAGKTLVTISTGAAWTCATATDGQAYCWGENSVGQLGNATLQDSLAPVAVDTASGLGGKTVSAISVSSFGHTCAIASGQAYCWGKNDGGKLGNGSTAYSTQATVPVPVLPLVTANISSIAFGETNGRKELQVTGAEFPPYLDALSRSLVTLNGVPLPFCADGTGATAQQLIDFNGVDPANVSDTPACYYIFSGGQAAMTATNVNIWLPDNFDITAAGSIAVDDSEIYNFNTPTTPTPTDDEVPPVVLNTPETVLPTHIDRLLLTAAPLNRTDNSSVVEIVSKSEVSVDDKPMVGTPVIASLPVFRGKTTPYSTVIVTVHSDPVTCTTKADENGNWKCALGTALPAGIHMVDIAVTTPENVTTHLGPYPVRVATAGQSQSPVQDIAVSASETKVPGWSLPWSLVVAIISIVIVTLVVAIARRKRQRDNH